MPKVISNNILAFNFRFMNNIKNLYIEKAFKKNCIVVYIYNNNNKNFIILYLLKLSGVS